MNTKGEFAYCGADMWFKSKFASLEENSIADIWNGPEYQRIRDLHLSRRGHEVELCRDCPDWKYRSWDYSYWKLEEYANGSV
jgi:hypothetical protein